MGNTVEAYFSGRKVGSIVFEESPAYLRAHRTAAGFSLGLPMTVRLKLSRSDEPCPLLSNIRAVISTQTEAGVLHQIGYARHDGWFVGAIEESTAPTDLTWRDVLPVLAFYERLRDGKPPRLKLDVQADVCLLIPSQRAKLRSEPWLVSGQVEIRYPTEVWIRMLRDMGVAESVFIEVPLPASPPAPWDGVWGALVEARNSFERGGETGWKGCVSAVRLALERWQEVEEGDMGPGWKAPSPEDRQNRTKRQRLDNIRWHLLQCAHLAPHTEAESWSRDDALLMLSALSALLAVRWP